MEGEVFAAIAAFGFAVRGVIAVIQKEAVAILTAAAGFILALGAFIANL